MIEARSALLGPDMYNRLTIDTVRDFSCCCCCSSSVMLLLLLHLIPVQIGSLPQLQDQFGTRAQLPRHIGAWPNLSKLIQPLLMLLVRLLFMLTDLLLLLACCCCFCFLGCYCCRSCSCCCCMRCKRTVLWLLLTELLLLQLKL